MRQLLLSSFFVLHALGDGDVLRKVPNARGWRQLQPKLTEQQFRVSFSIALREDLDLLTALARNVSTPGNIKYGQHLSASDIGQLTGPSQDDLAIVRSWLTKHAVPFTEITPAFFEVATTAASASSLLQTQFHQLVNIQTGQITFRAGDFWLPASVNRAIAAIYGVHSLPLPLQKQTTHSASINVTPSVLRTTYRIPIQAPWEPGRNRQAIAEFQGQTFRSTDLMNFFNSYMPNQPLSNARIHGYVGDDARGVSGTEAALDIEYIMSTAPGILTEYWYWANNDFCADLKNWTTAILTAENPPLVHSVSYGWQGEIADIGCSESIVQNIDSDFTKLAARGISILFASGDSGSGYIPPETCGVGAELLDTGLDGTPIVNITAVSSEQCCYELKENRSVTAWTFIPLIPTVGDSAPHPTCNETGGVEFQGNIRFFFNGTSRYPVEKEDCCRYAKAVIDGSVVGYTFMNLSENRSMCALWRSIESVKPSAPNVFSAHIVPRKAGTCLGYDSFNGTSKQTGLVSGGPSLIKPKPPKLYPSWPASSPWVTAVGATRFTNVKTEMASDAFGSGGGFSWMFSRFKEQSTAVDHHLKTAELPPHGYYASSGRGTPDVALLGEGYQVISNNTLLSVGGTSASAPVFAALVSLLNDARNRHAKPPMGYLNPWLYENPGMFTDITAGSNAINRYGFRVRYGFNCSRGWDPVTGLGTPVFEKMLQAALQQSHREPVFV